MRLAKYLATSGVASRRASEEIVRSGRVTVQGHTVTDPAHDVSDAHDVRVDGKPVSPAVPARVVYALNKPAGVVSTAHDTHGRPTVVDLVPSGIRLYPVGRLDADTTGLILLTNDGELANRLTHPRYEVPKTYRAKVRNAPVEEPALRALRAGVELDDGPAAVDSFRVVDRAGSRVMVEVVLHEGRNRIVRRIFEAVDKPVERLVRTAVGDVHLGNQRAGTLRRLGRDEVGSLYKAVGL
jgi:23S rRNA pseudouridine2605 synthase